MHPFLTCASLRSYEYVYQGDCRQKSPPGAVAPHPGILSKPREPRELGESLKSPGNSCGFWEMPLILPNEDSLDLKYEEMFIYFLTCGI